MANPTFDAIVGLLLHAHAIGDVSGAVAATFDTRANIIASTPVVPTLAYATDTQEWFVWNNPAGAWYVCALPLGISSPGVDIGAAGYNQDFGYGVRDLADKKLHNVVLSEFTTGIMSLEAGGIRRNSATNTPEYYNGSAWLVIVTLTQAQIDDWMLRTQWNSLSATTLAGRETETVNYMTLGLVDVGAEQSDLILDGGVLL